MKKYAVFLKGKGEGCDYTIGCNQTLKILKAQDLSQAQDEVAKLLEDYSDDMYMDEVIIFEGEQHRFEYYKWRLNRLNAQDAEKKLEEEKWERAEYEKLKKKFESDDKDLGKINNR